MAHEKLYTAKQAAQSVLDKVSEILQKSESVKKSLGGVHGMSATQHAAKTGASHGTGEKWSGGTSSAGEDIRAAGKKFVDAEGKKSLIDGAKKMHADKLSELKAAPKPNLPKSEDMGKAEHDKCPTCGHPSPASGQGDTLPRTKAQENWMEKAEPKGEIHPKEPQAGESEKPGARIQAQKDPQHNAKEQAEGNNELAGTTPTQVGQDGKNIIGQDEMKGHLKLAKFIGMKHYKRGKALNSEQSVSGAEAQHQDSIKDK
jgi:hypothetical protein